jgi:Glyoxalase-like domain
LTLKSRVDHLVVAAASLEQGVAWCRDTLGMEPGPGGEHPLMGTHNRLLRIATPRYPRAYLEIIAINPAAPDPGRTRWFDLDSEAVRQAMAEGPRLVHFVTSTNDGAGAVAALAGLGLDRGRLIAAERPTPAGMLRWKISVRDDGQRLFAGALPTLIEWGEAHPADKMPDCGIALHTLRVSHPRAAQLRAAFGAIGLAAVDVLDGPPGLLAALSTPSGELALESAGV